MHVCVVKLRWLIVTQQPRYRHGMLWLCKFSRLSSNWLRLVTWNLLVLRKLRKAAKGNWGSEVSARCKAY